MKRPVIRKIRSKVYSQVLRVEAPITFFWSDGIFDGIEIDCKGRRLTMYQGELGRAVFEAVGKAIGEEPSEGEIVKVRKRKTGIPKVFKDAFENCIENA